MARGGRRAINMLEGSIWDRMLVFAIPLAFTGVLQQLFNTADVFCLGQFVGKNAMAAVGSTTPVIGSVVSLLMGLSLGANVVIARSLGARKPEAIEPAVHTAVALSVLSGLLFLLFGEAVARPLLALLGTPGDVMPLAETYLRIYFAGFPAIALYNFEAAILRSRGDTRTPLLALFAATVVNITLNLLAVTALDLGIAGVAAATSAANYAAAAILFAALLRSPDLLRLSPGRIRLVRAPLREIVRIGLPAGIQGMVFSLSNLVIQSAINSLGADAIAASAAAFTIEINVYCFINAIGQAVTTFVSQNCGARNFPRCLRVTRVGMALEVAGSTVIGGLVIALAEPLMRIFTSDPGVVALGIIRILYVVVPTYVNCGIETLSSALRGYGISLAPAMNALVCICGVRILWVWIAFPQRPEFSTLMAVYPLSWSVTLLILCFIYFWYRKELAYKIGSKVA